jgi:3-deoxy-D-manno-octulosonic acid kinase
MSSSVRVATQARAALMFDPRVLGDAPDPRWLEAAHWRAADAVVADARGRGQTLIVRTPVGMAALRPYRRGGFAARALGNRYLWTGAAHTRPFREFAVLQYARAQGLAVPEPWAARYERGSLFYRASLLMRAIDGANTLAQRLHESAKDIDWAAVGTAIARMHAVGIAHADLNAHNILFDTADRVWLIDFDNAQRRAPMSSWQHAVLARLHRSLTKLEAPRCVRQFEAQAWPALRAAHERTLVEAAT